MNDASFLKAIRSSPGDDHLRLVYADWLDEHGQADRAEFIRLQFRLEALTGGLGWLRDEAVCCQEATADGLRIPYEGDFAWLERLSFASGCAPSPEEEALRKRQADLLAANQQEWKHGLPLAGWFRRGFLDGVHGTPAQLLEHAVVLRDCPTLRCFCIDFYTEYTERDEFDYDEWVQRARGAGLFERCESLLVTCPAHDDRDELVAWSLFPRLRRLVIYGDDNLIYRPPDPGTFQGNLRWYEVPMWRLGNNAEAGWPDEYFERHVLGSLEGAGLEYLDFSWNDLTGDGVIALAGSEKSRDLRTLRLHGSWLGDNGRAAVEALSRSPHLTRLEHLDLGSAFLDDEALTPLLDSPLLGQLRLLDISHNAVTAEGTQRLIMNPAAAGLRVLVLSSSLEDTSPANQASRAMSESHRPPGLRIIVG